MPKRVFRGNENKRKVIEGIEKAVQIVTSTYGGQGGTVMYQPLHGPGSFTKDGYEVSRNIHFDDLLENVGAKFVKEICDKMAFKVGDGTTTIAAVFGALVREVFKHEMAGTFPRQLVSGLKFAIEEAEKILKTIAIKIKNDDYEKLRSIALVSSNYDEAVADFITEAYRSINEKGFKGNPVILIEESKTEHSTISIVEGMQLYRGIATPQFFKDGEKNTMKIELNDPLILIIGKAVTLNDIQQLFPTLEQVVKQNKNFVIFANDFNEEAINFFTTNRHRGVSNGVCVKIPGFGDGQLSIAQDIAIRTGGQVLCETSMTLSIESINLNQYIGTAEKICIERDITIIIGGNGNKEHITERYNKLQEEYNQQGLSSYQKNQYENRISSMTGIVCVIKVGGVSEMTVKETRDRVEDAYHGTQNSLLYGIVPGGSIDMIYVVHKLREKLVQEYTNGYFRGDHKLGLEILIEVLRQPFLMLMESCNVSGDVGEISIIEKYKENNKLEYGIDVRTGKLVNFMEQGILNPAAVSSAVLHILQEIMSVFITCNVFIVESPEEDKGLKNGFNAI